MSRNTTEFLNGRSESVKLKAELINLGLVQDIDKEIANLNKLKGAVSKVEATAISQFKKLEDSFQKLLDSSSDLFDKNKDVLDNASDARGASIKLYDKAIAAAKELGLEAKDIKGVNELITISNSLVGDIDSAEASNTNIMNFYK